MNIAEFKQLLDIPEEAEQEAIQHRFSLLVESLFRNFQIEKEGIVYDLLEIEFYFWSPAHQDNITYPRHCPAGLWYFHPSGVDIRLLVMKITMAAFSCALLSGWLPSRKSLQVQFGLLITFSIVWTRLVMTSFINLALCLNCNRIPFVV